MKSDLDDGDRELLRHGWRLDALDAWRRDTDQRVTGIERQVAELVKADQIADAVASKVSDQQHVHLSVVQRRWAFIFGGATAIGSLSGVAALVLSIKGV